jgi:hypothetical protein
MSRNVTIPTKDADFNTAQDVIATKANMNAPMWGLDPIWMSKVMTEKAAWDAAWAAWKDPATRTPTITFVKNEKRDVYETSLRKLVKILQNDPRVTDDDLNSMGIVIPSSSKKPSKVATTYPDYDIDSSVIRQLRILFYDQGQKKSKAKPEGQHGVEIRWAILDAPPGSLKDLINSSFDTHTPFTLTFDESDRGKTVYFCLCWENTRGIKGPWSEIQKAIIP